MRKFLIVQQEVGTENDCRNVGSFCFGPSNYSVVNRLHPFANVF